MVGHAVTMGGWEASLAAFVVAALIIVLLLFGLAMAIGTAQEQVVATLRASTAQVKRWGGWILILVGVWSIALAIWADWFARIFPV
ncbi:MAG: hypothetical protein ACRDJH_26045 [Thermomicrobiales bacterium]